MGEFRFWECSEIVIECGFVSFLENLGESDTQENQTPNLSRQIRGLRVVNAPAIEGCDLPAFTPLLRKVGCLISF